MKKIVLSFLIILCAFIVIFVSVFYFNTKKIEADHEKISKILNEALLSNNSTEKFNQLLPEIKKFDSVERAWIVGYTFYIKYKNGGQFSWIITKNGMD